MDVRVAAITDETLDDVLEGCRRCVYWECPEEFRKAPPEQAEKIKADWFASTSEEMGTCGLVLYADETPAAYCQFAPPRRVPGIQGYGELAEHVDKDAAFITCLVVRDGYKRKGLGRRLLEEAVSELRGRGFAAVETFARNDSDDNCSGPTGFYVSRGFEVVATKSWPRSSLSLVRMEL